MADQVNNENLQILLTKLMTERFCQRETSDMDACVQNFVPDHSDGSYVDQYIQRKGMRLCEPYQKVAQKCMQDENKHNAIFRAAAVAPMCKQEQRALQKCQSRRGRDCEKEALETVYCGMIGIVQMKKERGPQRSSAE